MVRKSKTLSRNRDPGVESDVEDFEGDLGDEDDMFRFECPLHLIRLSLMLAKVNSLRLGTPACFSGSTWDHKRSEN